MNVSRFANWIGASKRRFILFNGALLFGLPVACFMALWDYASGDPISLTTFVVAPLVGLAVGWFEWRQKERRKAAHPERTEKT